MYLDEDILKATIYSGFFIFWLLKSTKSPKKVETQPINTIQFVEKW